MAGDHTRENPVSCDARVKEGYEGLPPIKNLKQLTQVS